MVSLAEAAAFLVERFGPGVDAVVPIGQGDWSSAFAFCHGGSDLVARFGQHVEDFEKDRLAARFASANLPIPAVTEIGVALGGWYAISDRAFGRFIDGLPLAEMRATLPSLLATLDAARAVDLSSTSGYGFWGSDGDARYPTWRATLLDIATEWPEGRLGDWRGRLATSPTGVGPFDEAVALLAGLVDDCPEERHLIHSDLLHFNVLVAGSRISAVVDWGCAMYGDHLYDLAWFAFWAPWHPAWDGIDWAREGERHYAAIGLDVPHLRERLRACQIHIGLSDQRYNASKGRWDMLDAIATRTLAIARGSR